VSIEAPHKIHDPTLLLLLKIFRQSKLTSAFKRLENATTVSTRKCRLPQFGILLQWESSGLSAVLFGYFISVLHQYIYVLKQLFPSVYVASGGLSIDNSL